MDKGDEQGNKSVNFGYDDSVKDMNDTLSQFRDDYFLCDLTLISSDQVEFPAHRIVLCSRCPYFYDELDENEIIFDSIKSNVLEKILRFIYKGTISLAEDDVIDINNAAGFLKMKILQEYCVVFLQSLTNNSNIFQMLTLAFDAKDEALLEHYEKYIIENFEALGNDAHFYEIPLRCMVNVLSSYDLYLNEDDIYEMINKWVAAHENITESQLEEAFTPLNMERLSKSALLEIVTSKIIHDKLPTMTQKAKGILSSMNRVYALPRKLKEEEKFECTQSSDVFAEPTTNSPTDFLVMISDHMDKHISFDFQKRKWYSRNHHNIRSNKCSTSSCDYNAWASGFCWYRGLTLICGGDINEVSQASVYIHDPTENKWNKGKDMLHHRTNHTVIGLGGYIYAIGGLVCKKKVERLRLSQDITNASWESVTSLKNEYSGHGTVILTINDKISIVCFGGLFNRSVEAYHPADDEWIELKDLNVVRDNPMYGVVKNVLYVFSLDNVKFSGEYYDAKVNQWTYIEKCAVMTTPGLMLSFGDWLYAIVEIKKRCVFVEFDTITKIWSIKDTNGPPFQNNSQTFALPVLNSD